MIFFRRVRRVLNGERLFLQVTSVREASRDDVAGRVVDVDGSDKRL